MREERSQKNLTSDKKSVGFLLSATLAGIVLFLIFPFLVFAQEEKIEDIENTETVFEDEMETDPDSDSDLDGFISGDGPSVKENTIHVIIENKDAGNEDPGNPDPTGDDTVTGAATSYGDVYTGGDSSGSSSVEKILHKPQLLLEDSNLSGQSLKAGTTQEMSVTFRNKSRSQNVYGLKISLSTETTGIEFDKNSFYVQRLTPGEAITLKQNISVAEDTDPGKVTISFALEYEDSKATGATGTEILTFNVTQPVRAELDVSDIPSIFYTMDTVEIPVKALNLGRDKIYNARVQLEADGLNSKETVFLGNVDAGTASEGTMKVYVKGFSENTDTSSGNSGAPVSGAATGKIRLTYEDSAGNSYETATDFTSEIKENQIQSLKIEEEQEETNSWWYSIIAVLAVLLISIILFLLTRLHKKSVLLEEARKAASH